LIVLESLFMHGINASGTKKPAHIFLQSLNEDIVLRVLVHLCMLTAAR